MIKLKTLIADDEPLARELMASVLANIEAVEVVGAARSGRETIELVRKLSPDLLFLDIEMPGGNGFDVVKALQADTMPMVIFATAYDQYALDAFNLHAVDYVLKPMDPVRVRQSVQQAVMRYTANRLLNLKGPLMGAIGEILRGKGKVEPDSPPSVEKEERKLAIRDTGSVEFVPFQDIEWVDAAGDYMCVHVGDKTHVMRSTMAELEEKLAGTSFARIHRSTLANLDKVCSIDVLPKGERLLHMEGGNSLKVSRNYRQAIARLG